MLFNPDPNKPAQEMLFSRKKQLKIHPTISPNNIQEVRESYQKHLAILLDEKLNFKQHVDNVIMKVNKVTSVIKKLRYSLPRKSPATINTAFLKPLMIMGISSMTNFKMNLFVKNQNLYSKKSR